MAVVTRSRLSLTAASGSPTITMFGSPPAPLTSISTSYASTPYTAAEEIFANIAVQSRKKSLRGKAPNIPLKWEATHARKFRRILGGDVGKQGEQDPLKRLNRRRPATVTIPNI